MSLVLSNKFELITSFVIATLLSLSAAVALINLPYDFNSIVVIDPAVRIYSGQILGEDFHSPIGATIIGSFASGLILGDIKFSFLSYILTHFILLIAWKLIMRPPVIVFFMALILGMYINAGAVSLASIYNHQGYFLVFLLTASIFSAFNYEALSKSQSIFIAILFIFLIFSKITFSFVSIGVMFVLLFSKHAKLGYVSLALIIPSLLLFPNYWEMQLKFIDINLANPSYLNLDSFKEIFWLFFGSSGKYSFLVFLIFASVLYLLSIKKYLLALTIGLSYLMNIAIEQTIQQPSNYMYSLAVFSFLSYENKNKLFKDISLVVLGVIFSIYSLPTFENFLPNSRVAYHGFKTRLNPSSCFNLNAMPSKFIQVGRIGFDESIIDVNNWSKNIPTYWHYKTTFNDKTYWKLDDVDLIFIDDNAMKSSVDSFLRIYKDKLDDYKKIVSNECTLYMRYKK